MDHIDTLIIGGGVMGLAIARELSRHHSVIVVEQEEYFATHTSSRNSEVIHAGIYYPSQSLKAKLCVEGKNELYRVCQAHHIPHAKIGKLIVASTQEDEARLASIQSQAQCNGINDLRYLNQQELKQYDYLNVSSALLSPSTGIIDSHQLMLFLQSEIERSGGILSTQSQFVQAQMLSAGFKVNLRCQGLPYTLQCDHLINAAGLFASEVAKHIEGMDNKEIASHYFCKGHYYAYHGSHPFKQLIYPLPQQHGLGIHATLDLSGQLKFGPNTEFIDKIDYHTNDTFKAEFITAIQDYWPALDPNKLTYDYSGIRPKTHMSGQQDFTIQGQQEHGITGLVNLFGIESPGLTASLAIAKHVAALLRA